MYYRNKSSGVQAINLNSGRSVYVQPGEEIELVGEESTSDEIIGKVRGSRPTGELFDRDVVVQSDERQVDDRSNEHVEVPAPPQDADRGWNEEPSRRGEERR